MVKDQDRYAYGLKGLIRHRTGLLDGGDAGSKHHPGQFLVAEGDGRGSGGNASAAGSHQPDRKARVAFQKTYDMPQVFDVVGAHPVGEVQILPVARLADSRHVEPVGGKQLPAADQKIGRVGVSSLTPRPPAPPGSNATVALAGSDFM